MLPCRPVSVSPQLQLAQQSGHEAAALLCFHTRRRRRTRGFHFHASPRVRVLPAKVRLLGLRPSVPLPLAVAAPSRTLGAASGLRSLGRASCTQHSPPLIRHAGRPATGESAGR